MDGGRRLWKGMVIFRGRGGFSGKREGETLGTRKVEGKEC